MNKVVVTGGAGFIGSHIVEELVNKKVHVTVIDTLKPGKADNIAHLMNDKYLEYVDGSIDDHKIIQKLFVGAEYIFHHAAAPNPSADLADYAGYYEANSHGMLNVLQAAKNNKVRKVIFASSCAIYGNRQEQPLREDMLSQPQSPYAMCKLINENYCTIYNKVHGLPTVCLRYFNVYGPRQNPESPLASVIPKFIKNISQGYPPAILGDGNQTRDFIYVKDVVRANLLTAENNSTGIFNIGSGAKVSLNQLAMLISKATGRDYIKAEHQKERPDDIRHSLADITRAKTFGYSPKYDLGKGLYETVRSFTDGS